MPGAELRRSMAHLGLSQRAPLRYSLMPSRRQSLQTESMVRAISPWSGSGKTPTGCCPWAYGNLDAAFLGRAAAVVWQRGDVLDGLDGQAGGLQGGDRRLAPGAGALDAHLDLLEAELARALGGR